MLKRVDEQRLFEAADDPAYLSAFNRVLSAYDSYHSEPLRRNGSEWLRQTDLVAYFCAEFGFHESFPIYSGGLGVLSGDHMKSASDLGAPIIGIGLLYTYGYFTQTLSREGWQQEGYTEHPADDLGGLLAVLLARRGTGAAGASPRPTMALCITKRHRISYEIRCLCFHTIPMPVSLPQLSSRHFFTSSTASKSGRQLRT